MISPERQEFSSPQLHTTVLFPCTQPLSLSYSVKIMIIVFWTSGPLHRLAFHCLTAALYSEVSSFKVHFQNVSFHKVFWGTVYQVLEYSGKPSGERSLPSELMLKGKGDQFLIDSRLIFIWCKLTLYHLEFSHPKMCIGSLKHILPRSGQNSY